MQKGRGKYVKTGENTNIALRNSAIIAGVALLVMAIVAPVANFAILQKLVVPDNIAETISNITESIGLFRTGTCLFLVVAILDIVVAWALYVFLEPINKSLSFLAALFRIVYAAILSIALANLVSLSQILSDKNYLASLETNQLHTQATLLLNTFTSSWNIGLAIFGFHLLLLGGLLCKAGYMKKILGALVVLASFGYLFDSFGKILLSGYNLQMAMFTFIGEIILMFWLLIKGGNQKELQHSKQRG